MEQKMKNISLSRKIVLFSLLILTLTGLYSFKKNSINSPQAAYRVTFINKYWNNLHLQVRVGNQSNPESNQLVQDVTLGRNQSVTVDYDVLCYYRRDSNPDEPNGSFTTWTSTGCFSNQSCVVDNP